MTNIHEIQWTAPSPLWLEAAAFDGLDAQRQMRAPAILRFAADTFMEDFLKIVETDPDKLRSLVAIKETWRGPAEKPEAETLLEPVAPQSSFARRLNRVRVVAERARNTGSLVAAVRNGDGRRLSPLKLYQPAHQRYYLVSGCLVCGITGLPDRALDTRGSGGHLRARALASGTRDVRGRLDLSVRRACVRGQATRIPPRLAFSLRGPALVDCQASWARLNPAAA